MKQINLLLLLGLALFSISCERDLDFSTPSEETAGDLVVNAVAVADAPFTLYLNKAYPVGKTPRLVLPTYDDAIFFKDDLTTDYVSNIYYKNTAVLDAQIEAEINGQQVYPMSLTANYDYTCDYKPKAGDHIVVNGIVNGQKLRAETTVPTKPKIEVLDYEVLNENPYQDKNGLFGGTDTIVRLKCQITDLGGEQYYRLRVRNEVDKKYAFYYWYYDGQAIDTDTIINYYMQDVYFSEDELFSDARLTSSMGGWSTNFSTVFDNSLMKSGSYTFTIDSPKASNTSGIIRYYWDFIGRYWEIENDAVPRVMIELQAISPELYNYMKSVQLYRVTTNDMYAEPVRLYSNVDGGWGILGALSYDRHFVEYE